MKLKQLTKDSEGVEIKLTIEQDDVSEMNFDSGEPEKDGELQHELYKRLSRGDTWAWCTVTVTASWGGWVGSTRWVGSTSLGGCSYEDEEDFRKGGYYNDMVEEAVNDLNQKLAKVAQGLSKLMELGEGLSA